MIDDHEKRLLNFLSSANNYLYKPDFVKIIQTHISIIAVAPPFVFKAKKNLTLSFLDYSTPEKRSYYIDREIELNKRLCPDLYLESLPIYEDGTSLSFHKKGKVYDHILKMLYLHPDDCLEGILRLNNFTSSMSERIATRLSIFYDSQKPISFDSSNRTEILQRPVINNIYELKNYTRDFLPLQCVNALLNYTQSFYDTFRSIFKKRILHGFVRDCHGDLRLEHIYLSDEKICIYDCIEFNDEFRQIDLANDLAFLAMEFDFYGFPNEGQELIERIFMHIQDRDGIRLISFYKIYRALVRAKVNCILAGEGEVESEKRLNSGIQGLKFLQLAMRYLIGGHLPVAIVVMGKTGTGKSTIAGIIAKHIGAQILSTDFLRKNMAKIDPYQETPEDLKSTIYSSEFSMSVYHTLTVEAKKILNEEKVVVLDGTFSKKKYRQLILDHLLFARIWFIELESSASISKDRLKGREKTGDISDARLKDKDTIDALYEKPDEIGQNMRVSIMNENGLDMLIDDLYKRIVEINLQEFKRTLDET